MNIQKDAVWEQLLPVAVVLIFYDLASGNTFFLMESILLFTGISFLWDMARKKGKPILDFFKKGKSMLIPFAVLGIYLLWDVLSVFRSRQFVPFWEKYRVVVPMGAFALMSFVYLKKSFAKRETIFLSALTLAGIVSALGAVMQAFLWNGKFCCYSRRLSLRVDYNMFSQVVLMGLAAGLLVQQNKKKRILLCLLCAPVIILSSSRRNTAFLLALLASQIIMDMQEKENIKPKIRCFLHWMLTLGMIFCISIAGQKFLDVRAERMLMQGNESGSFSDSGAIQRYLLPEEEEQKSPSKRKIIWSAAWQDFQQVQPLQKIFGQGFGSDLLLYAQSDDPRLTALYNRKALQKLSAHSFVLADCINLGSVGAVLGLLFWALLGMKLLCCFVVQGKRKGIFLGFLYGTVLVSNLISNRYGFLYDKYFWILLVLLGSCRCQCVKIWYNGGQASKRK